MYLVNINYLQRGVLTSHLQERDRDIAQTYRQIELMNSERANLTESLAHCQIANQHQPIICSINNGPKDRIREQKILVNQQRVIVTLDDAILGSLEATGSMLPTFGETAHLIQTVPLSADDLVVGDIIAYETSGTSALTVHRIVSVGNDEKGWFVTTKGDNASINDPTPVRFGAIRFVVVGILY